MDTEGEKTEKESEGGEGTEGIVEEGEGGVEEEKGEEEGGVEEEEGEEEGGVEEEKGEEEGGEVEEKGEEEGGVEEEKGEEEGGEVEEKGEEEGGVEEEKGEEEGRVEEEKGEEEGRVEEVEEEEAEEIKEGDESEPQSEEEEDSEGEVHCKELVSYNAYLGSYFLQRLQKKLLLMKRKPHPLARNRCPLLKRRKRPCQWTRLLPHRKTHPQPTRNHRKVNRNVVKRHNSRTVNPPQVHGFSSIYLHVYMYILHFTIPLRL